MCSKCDNFDIKTEVNRGMRAAIFKEVEILCPDCKQSCCVLHVGLGDKILVNDNLIAIVDMKTEKIKINKGQI